VSLPFALVRHGADDVPVLLGVAGNGELAGLDLVEGRYLTFDPEDIGTVFDVDPAAIYFGIEVAWAREMNQRMAAETSSSKKLTFVGEAARLPRRAALGRKFTPVLGELTGFSEVRSTLLRHRAEVPTLSTIVLTTVFAGLTVGTLIAVAERGFACITDLFEKARELPALDEVRGCIWPLGYHHAREELYKSAPAWAPLVQAAIRDGLRDRDLRRHLFLQTETPHGISLAKLSFVLALLGHDLVCLDVRILDRMFGAGKASEYSQTWGRVSELSLARYERVEDAFLRGNPFYNASDPIGKARAQWISWESAGRPARAEAHHSWLNVVRGAS
jgi:hypothetical protein